MRSLGRNLALVLAAAVITSGCGSHSTDAGTQTPAKSAIKKAANPADRLSRNMVSAVAATKPSTLPVQVKFDLKDRPDVGQPASVDLAIVPMSASVDRVSGKVEVDDGLDLVDGAEIAPSDRPAEGVPIRHTVTVLPKRPGIYTVRAVLTVDAAGTSSTDSYSIPVIADSAASESPAKPGAPAAGAAAARMSDAHSGAPASAAAQ